MASFSRDFKMSFTLQGLGQRMVRQFHETFDPESVAERCHMPTAEVLDMRLRLIKEEAEEFEAELEAFLQGDTTEEEALLLAAKELADLLYVVYGAAVTLGIDLDEVLQLVHDSNMSKTWSDQEVRDLLESDDPGEAAVGSKEAAGWVVYREDGKVLKPPGYKPVDDETLRGVLGL